MKLHIRSFLLCCALINCFIKIISFSSNILFTVTVAKFSSCPIWRLQSKKSQKKLRSAGTICLMRILSKEFFKFYIIATNFSRKSWFIIRFSTYIPLKPNSLLQFEFLFDFIIIFINLQIDCFTYETTKTSNTFTFSENRLIFAVQFRSDKTYLGKCNLIIITINKS